MKTLLIVLSAEESKPEQATEESKPDSGEAASGEASTSAEAAAGSADVELKIEEAADKKEETPAAAAESKG